MPRPSGGRSRREPCAKCGLPVFIAERLNVGKQLYHRTCFRCARCNSQLTLANYYETETENQFCCETCPDEEQIKKISDNDDEKSVLNRSLSDEEKSAGIQKPDDHDDYSCMFETALENPNDKNLSTNYTLSSEQSVEFTKARSRFIASQLIESECDTSDDEAPELPKSEPPDLNSLKTNNELEFVESSENTKVLKESKDLNSENISSILSSEVIGSCDSGFVPQSLDSLVYSSSKVSDVSDINQPETAVKQLDTNKIITKENKFPSDNSSGSSLVKSRMRLFENKFAGDQSSNEDMKKCSVVKDITNKDAEKKFIHKVPLVEEDDEERNCSTGLGSKSLVIKESESDNSINNSSLVDAVDNKNEENHTEQKQEKQEVIKSAEDSIIIISSDTSKEDSVNKNIESSDSVNKESPIIISDSSSNNQSSDNKITSEETPSVNDISDLADNVIESKNEEEYPEDLNPFGDEDEQELPNKSKVDQSLNPFDDDDDMEIQKVSPKPAVRRKIKAKQSLITGKNEGTPEHLAQIQIQRISYNPFEDDEDEEEENKKETLPIANKVVPAPRISLNPFWSDGEEPEEEEDSDKQKPVPLPRNSRSSAIGTPEPKPRKSGLSISSGLSSGAFGSNTSLSSAHSSIGPTLRKKKQAPKPPPVPDKQESAQSSLTSSPSPSVQHSPKSTPKIRKSKKAPLPPSVTSTPLMVHKEPVITSEISPIVHDDDDKPQPIEASKEKTVVETGEWEKEKIIKDELNRNRQSQAGMDSSSPENSSGLPVPNKSTYGKWKRRKGPAPSRPIPQRRNIKPLPIVEIKRELEFIEIQQQGLEKQGVRLEQIIREKCEGPTADLDASLSSDVEDLILQLFELVNEKNELFRKQTELMYLRRQQRLEEEYADLEYQIRCLMMQPEANKTDSDKAREEELINRLVEVVERRNEIVECLEMDRVREAEEDDSINNQLNLYALKREDDSLARGNPDESKQKKKHKKEKKFKFKTSKKVDIDKDIDECESSGASLPSSNKDKKKKKFNIF
ncbi:hypothetical protein ILUMI_12210 [Ignelater luminosus]|uniref:MICAL-like protein 1 n=1 Tax=Ignelater luminosus TaxID=2038154 RepID=A0A8K0D3C4_IGNLU|nr:hypothetical protein ILUMI_12210 [Ignelater luminosus]